MGQVEINVDGLPWLKACVMGLLIVVVFRATDIIIDYAYRKIYKP